MNEPLTRRYLSLAIDLAGQSCLVVGGGQVAARKVRTLLEAGAQVTVVAPRLADDVRHLIRDGVIRWIDSEYASEHLEGTLFVVAATDNLDLNLHGPAEAEARRIWCCLAAPGDRSRVIFPAVYADDEVTIAVHSDGRDCRRSQAVRDEIRRLRQQQEQQQQ